MGNLPQLVENDTILISYAKYIKIFKIVDLRITDEFLNHWEIISNFILNHVTKMNVIKFSVAFVDPSTIPDFDSFLFHFLQNSQSTLKRLLFGNSIFRILDMPDISFPNVIEVMTVMNTEYDEQITFFQNFVKNIITNCEDLKKFVIYNMHKC